MSRPNLGLEHVDKLEGERESKVRLKAILQTLCGDLSVGDAAERLGVGLSRFAQLRDEALSGALESLEPRPAGRPAHESVVSTRVLELERELDATRRQLELERVRTQILVAMPGLARGKAQPPRRAGGRRGGVGGGT